MEGIVISAASVQSLKIADIQTRDALFCAMTDYAKDGTEPNLENFDLAQKMVWPFLKEDIDRQKALYEQGMASTQEENTGEANTGENAKNLTSSQQPRQIRYTSALFAP